MVNTNDLDKPAPLWKIIAVASVAAGVQFGWALQLSLLTPYVQHLGVPHVWSSFIWLCGPISGMVVQPIVGYTSDRSTCRFGRRKPFIAVGSALICAAVLLIGFALDIGSRLGDSLDQVTKSRAVGLFVTGFWILDIANNMVQDPTRAFLADLSKHNHRRIRIANAWFSFFMAVGNILGYAAGSYSNLYKLLPFTRTEVCDVYCANLKTCFFLDIIFLSVLSTTALLTVSEPAFEGPSEAESASFVEQVKAAFRNLGKPMWLLFLVTALNWIAWFPFLMFDTDWVGTEVFGGKVDGTPQQKGLYDAGVRHGSLGLLLTAATLGFMSVLIDPLSKVLGGARRLWGALNFVLAASLALTVLVTKKAEHERLSMVPGSQPRKGVKAATLALFAAMGIPQAVTFSIPFALASIFSSDSGAGHGLSLGVLNLAIVIPQMFVSMISGPVDQLFGGGNLPAFVLGAVSATLSGILALTILPPPSSNTISKREQETTSTFQPSFAAITNCDGLQIQLRFLSSTHTIRSSSKSLFKALAPPIPFQRVIPSFSCSLQLQPPANSRTFSTPAKSSFTWDDVFRISASESSDSSDFSGFFDKISACNRNSDKQSDFLPFVVEDQIVGFVHNGFADILRSYQDVFVFPPVGTLRAPSSGYVTLQTALGTSEERTNAVANVIRSLGEDVIPGIRNELYPITSSFGSKEFLSLERAAAPFFGIKAYGVHMNGYVESGGEEYLWVGKRSQEKPTFPGMLDHLVAGGLPHGIACSENIIKECEEEAGIPRSVAKCAKAVGAISYSDIDGYKYRRDVLFCYDLKVPQDFIPSNQDGEVESFKLIPVSYVMNIIKQTNFFKPNCCLVIIDFLVRHGHITPDDAGYLKLLQSLRSGDCS